MKPEPASPDFSPAQDEDELEVNPNAEERVDVTVNRGDAALNTGIPSPVVGPGDSPPGVAAAEAGGEIDEAVGVDVTGIGAESGGEVGVVLAKVVREMKKGDGVVS